MVDQPGPKDSFDFREKIPVSWLLFSFIVIVIVAAAFRIIGLDKAPPGLRYDEVQNYAIVERILSGERPLFFEEGWGREPLYYYVEAATMTVFGESDWSLRLPSVLFGLLGIVGVGLAGRTLFDDRVALLAAAIMAVSFWAVFYSRVALRLVGTPAFASFMVFFLWRAMARPRFLQWRTLVELSLTGVLSAAMVYTYIAGRFALALLPLFLIYLLIFHRSRFQTLWPRFVFIFLVTAFLVAPLALLLYQQPSQQPRLDQLNAPLTAFLGGNIKPALSMTRQAVGMFFLRGEQDWLYNMHGRPVFQPLMAFFMIGGWAISLWRWRQLNHAFILLWLFVGILPAIFALPAASMTHTIFAQPASMILAALGLAAFWIAIEKRYARLVVVIICLIILATAAFTFRDYFAIWNKQDDVQELYQASISDVADSILELEAGGPIVIGAPFIDYWNPWNKVAFDLAVSSQISDIRWFNPAWAWVWPAGDSASTYYFPERPLEVQQFNPVLEQLFAADARQLSESERAYTSYRVEHPWHLEQILGALSESSHLIWPPGTAESRKPHLPLTFQNRLDLIGVQIPESQFAPGDFVELVTFWQVQVADAAPIVSFTHLTSDGLDIWGQQDRLDVQMEGLNPGDRFAQVHRLQVGAGTPAGRYYLQLGLYSPVTQERVSILIGTDSVADRILVGEIDIHN